VLASPVRSEHRQSLASRGTPAGVRCARPNSSERAQWPQRKAPPIVRGLYNDRPDTLHNGTLHNAHRPSTMTISVTGTVTAMRSNKLVNMDIEQLRGWATILDRAVVVSLVVTIMAVVALATTTFLSIRVGGAMRAREHAAFLGYRAEMSKHAVELE